MMEQPYIPKSAMVIVAHPDDVEYTCAGTLALWAKHGARISYVVCTSGEVGIAEPGMSKSKAVEIRESEQLEAAHVVGSDEVIFLKEPDGMLQATMDLRRKIVREIRRFRPEVVLCGDPTVILVGDSYINHPDHRAASLAALEAVFPAAGQPNLFEEFEAEGYLAHKTRKVYITNRTQVDQTVDIGETIDIKIKALKKHVSQMKGHDPEKRIKEWAAERAKNLDGVQFAEGFRVITLESDEDWKERSGNILFDPVDPKQ